MNTDYRPIVLIGPMGCGKSTVGRALADKTGFLFIDLDALIEESLSMSITDMFKIYGERYFRVKEKEFLKDCLLQKNCVIATGGGIVTQDVNCQAIKEHGLCIYLYADVETQYRRTLDDDKRPMIASHDRYNRLKELFEKRSHLYRQVSDFTIDTNAYDVEEIVSVALLKLKDYTCRS